MSPATSQQPQEAGQLQKTKGQEPQGLSGLRRGDLHDHEYVLSSRSSTDNQLSLEKRSKYGDPAGEARLSGN